MGVNYVGASVEQNNGQGYFYTTTPVRAKNIDLSDRLKTINKSDVSGFHIRY
ncbi:MAG: hypothetical protein GXO92_05815 [FCB group bacterium]|nr:hypothetical protein [FCB group bacterium]